MPAADFAFGAPLSLIGEHALTEGLRTVRALVESVQQTGMDEERGPTKV